MFAVIVVRHPNGECYSSQFFVQTNASAINRSLHVNAVKEVASNLTFEHKIITCRHLIGQKVKLEINGRATEIPMHIAEDGRYLLALRVLTMRK